MGRFAFILCLGFLSQLTVIGSSNAQQPTDQAASDQRPLVPVMSAAESPSGSVAPNLETADTAEAKKRAGELKPPGLGADKKKSSAIEEFFSSPFNYLCLLIVSLYVYLMFVQPRGARQERKRQAERLSQLKKNDRVVTASGIHGVVSNINIEAGTVTLRVDENSNSKLTIDRSSIRSVAS